MMHKKSEAWPCCHLYQGYYYSRPLEINGFIQFMESIEGGKRTM